MDHHRRRKKLREILLEFQLSSSLMKRKDQRLGFSLSREYEGKLVINICSIE